MRITELLKSLGQNPADRVIQRAEEVGIFQLGDADLSNDLNLVSKYDVNEATQPETGKALVRLIKGFGPGGTARLIQIYKNSLPSMLDKDI